MFFYQSASRHVIHIPHQDAFKCTQKHTKTHQKKSRFLAHLKGPASSIWRPFKAWGYIVAQPYSLVPVSKDSSCYPLLHPTSQAHTLDRKTLCKSWQSRAPDGTGREPIRWRDRQRGCPDSSTSKLAHLIPLWQQAQALPASAAEPCWALHTRQTASSLRHARFLRHPQHPPVPGSQQSAPLQEDWAGRHRDQEPAPNRINYPGLVSLLLLNIPSSTDLQGCLELLQSHGTVTVCVEDGDEPAQVTAHDHSKWEFRILASILERKWVRAAYAR